jgi:hypothetical protein
MKNLIVILIAVIGISSLTSCSTSEHCWAYSDVKQVRASHSNRSVGYHKNHKKIKRNGAKSYSCYTFD